MIIGDGIVLGAGGETARIFVTGLSETAAVTATKGSKTMTGKWMQKLNPAYHNLPDGYTELEYIQCTGSQYIDVGVKPDFANLVRVKSKFLIANTTIRNCVCGTFSSGETISLNLEFANDGSFRIYQNSSLNTTATANITANVPFEIEYNYDSSAVGVDVNGSRILSASLSTSQKTTNSLHIFRDGRSDVFTGTQRCYEFEYQNGAEQIHLIPCKRNSDNAIGMYDILSNTFFGNAGSGTFSAGEEIPQYFTGFEIAPVKSYGTWTVTATDGTRTKTQDVLIDSAIEYSVNISFRLTIISNNDLHEDVTGGYTYTSSVWGLSIDSDGNVKVTRNGDWTTPPTTNNSIDLTEYSTFYVRSKQDRYAGGVWVYDESDSGLSSGVELCLYTDKNTWVELTGSLSELGITGKKRIQLAGNVSNIWYSDLWFE